MPLWGIWQEIIDRRIDMTEPDRIDWENAEERDLDEE
jgi:hypothetical protein